MRRFINMSSKYVYFFGGGHADGNATMRDLLGGKGSNLAEMASLNILVPAGFTISTEVCTHFYRNNYQYPPGLHSEIEQNLAKVEEAMGTPFGDPKNPLLISIRSGARVSMPGMMDTVLNIGLNDETVEGLARASGDDRFAWDCYRRLIQMYGNVVLGAQHSEFEGTLQDIKMRAGVVQDTELTAEDLRALVVQYKELIRERTGEEFPADPRQQLWGGIGAVFRSWNTERAIEYRRLNEIPDDWGTAVNVQAMVYGNMGDESATGVAFTRDPATGKNVFYGEYLRNAQGEDVVAGIRTPHPLNLVQKGESDLASLEEEMPAIYADLVDIRSRLERHYKDMQDIEFTIQQGKLWMLQTRTGKRTAPAAVKIAVDMVKDGLITKETALLRVEAEQLDQLLHPMIDPKTTVPVLARGLPASPGAAAGEVVFSAEEAVKLSHENRKSILVRSETSPEDIAGMAVSQGILTARGGMTSHAAVVARGMGKPCVAGCSTLEVDYEDHLFRVGTTVVKAGDLISIDGATGKIFLGEVPLIEPELTGEFGELMTWADEVRRLGIRTNADNARDAQVARHFGAEGIGLCRTEHMFFAPERVNAMREMIVAESEHGRREALAHLLPMQREDFISIFREMDGLPVIIRTLDPPLHEFLPAEREDIQAMAEKIGVTYTTLKARVLALREANPMLGHRGCRLGITYPEITEMQARAIFEAACQVTSEGKNVIPKVMIPLVNTGEELRRQREVVEKIAQQVMEENGIVVEYSVGTMIELPRACVTADEIARYADFFSFGTNDLTQTTFGFSRDDVAKFIGLYLQEGILKHDPFARLDQQGVGKLVAMGIELGRSTRPDLEVGICGEHGGDPSSIQFCHDEGLDYVSCSPYRVPIARLAAAQAALHEAQRKKEG
jgi:pyruvate,orthophosphate dikinase